MTEQTLYTYNIEPVIGHHYQIEVYDSRNESIKKLREELDLPDKDKRRARITEHDVAWEEKREVSMRIDVFEEMIDAYRHANKE